MYINITLTAEIDTLGINMPLIIGLMNNHRCQTKSFKTCISDSLNSLLPLLIIDILEI